MTVQSSVEVVDQKAMRVVPYFDRVIKTARSQEACRGQIGQRVNPVSVTTICRVKSEQQQSIICIPYLYF
jgi:hypothetical protein